jgi:hypothetical protein
MTRENFSVTRKAVRASLALLPLLAACESIVTDAPADADHAVVAIQLTDANADAIQTADVWVSKVYLQGGPGSRNDTADASTGGRVYLFNDPSKAFHVDLLTLRNGIVANLTDSVRIEAGAYRQLRIVVDSVKLALKAGFRFEDGATTKTVKTPSGSTSGVKVQLSKDIETAGGDTLLVLADFDVEASINLPNSPNAPNTFRNPSMSPVIKERSRR